MLSITSLPPLSITHAQPLPKRPIAAFLNSSFSESKPPNETLIASAIAPLGAPPPFGPMISQNIVWFAWPPPLLRTGRADVFGHRVDACEQFLDRLRMQLGMLVERGVQVGHVRLVVLAVMNLHRPRVDVRFERVESVGKRWKRMSHRAVLLVGLRPVRTERES